MRHSDAIGSACRSLLIDTVRRETKGDYPISSREIKGWIICSTILTTYKAWFNRSLFMTVTTNFVTSDSSLHSLTKTVSRLRFQKESSFSANTHLHTRP